MKKYAVISVVIFLLFSNLYFLAAQSYLEGVKAPPAHFYIIFFIFNTTVPLASLVTLVSGLVVSASQPNQLTKSLSSIYGVVVCAYLVMAATSGIGYDPDWLYYSYSFLLDWGFEGVVIGLIGVMLVLIAGLCLIIKSKDV